MYSVKQTADMSGRTDRTIRRMIAEGKLKCVKDSRGRVWIEERNLPARRTGKKDQLIMELQRQVAELRQRLESAELGGTQRRPIPVPRQSRQIASAIPALPMATAGELPSSNRQRGFWVENHGGPKGPSVRIGWMDVGTWSSIADALAGMRQHDYEPTECAEAACGCHALLKS